ncbi:MAG: SRPBCC family protein [Acidimicrobiia bacterium]
MTTTVPGSDVETVERVIPAPPEKIFDLLADPRRHHDIDGSGTVRDAKDSPERLSLGATFGMSMKLGITYTMTSTVTEYDENKRIAWQTRGPGKIGQKFGGRIWRYELEPVDGGTRVRESWDISQERTKAMVRPARKKTRKSMEQTLARIEELVTS